QLRQNLIRSPAHPRTYPGQDDPALCSPEPRHAACGQQRSNFGCRLSDGCHAESGAGCPLGGCFGVGAWIVDWCATCQTMANLDIRG
ncbi:MAG: hypothetical protein EBW14_22275, partial [Oxalobacteraceae bacterium]|nr:hypothetical protein [Oxalobacteraceae bacterium]